MAREGEHVGDVEGLRANPVQGVESLNGGIVVRLAGELDLYNAEAVRSALVESAAERPARLVVDMSRVEFIDSTALGVLVEARSRLANQRSFILASPRLETRRALEVSGLDRHFTVRETVDEALASELD